jgi:hypothetical protein
MRGQRAMKAVLVLVGLVFSAGVYPVAESLWRENPSMYPFDTSRAGFVPPAVL